MTLKLGIIGLSQGNGHPYSWAAIFNGYEPDAMEACGFPVIPRYLEQRQWPDDAIADATVTHVWTQDRAISEHVARAGRIAHVVQRPEDMIGAIDALLLARDDSETHFELAKPFLEAGLPVYIDKPICLTEAELDRFYALERFPGQIFTCSALRYGPDFQLSAKDRDAIGNIREIHAITPKYWNTYAVHVVEPMLALVGDPGALSSFTAFPRPGGGATLFAQWENGFRATITAMGEGPQCPLSLRVMGETGWRDLTFADSFTAFRAALQDFVDGIRARDVRTAPAFVRRVVQVLQAGRPR